MRHFLTIGAGMLVPLGIFAQGTMDFKNSATTLVTNSLTGQPAVAGGSFRAQLYWAPLNNPTNFTPLGGTAIVGVPVAGRFVGGTRTTGAMTAPGIQARFIVRCWESAYGATYEAALASAPINGRKALTGQSVVVQSATGDGLFALPGLLYPALAGITLVTETPVIRSITSGGGGTTLLWAAIPGRTYRVEFKTALGDPTVLWQPLSGNIVAAGFAASKVDNTIGPRQRFYRVVLLP